jgi:hypothetical protein
MSREAFEAAFPAPRCCIWDAVEQDYYLDVIQRPTRKEQLLALQHGFRWEGWKAALQSAGQAKAVATVENGVLNWIDGCQLAGPVDLVIGQIDGLQHTQVDFLT